VFDYSPYILFALSAVVVPGMGYLVSSTISVKAKLQAHEATDDVRFKNIHESLERLEHGTEKVNAKLDRIIERVR
jgi:hypothetical protein